jgi:predicted TIM-barrel fold metal-dependent hydrolase
VEQEGGDPSGFKGVPNWSLDADQKFNSEYDISTTILSLTAPGACIRKTPEGRADLARRCNEYLAKFRDDAPHRYGFFATLPSMTDKKEFLAEVAYSLDVLKADGITVFTRYGTGYQYLGHPDFTDIWAELNQRGAVVFVHPTHPVDTHLVNPKMVQPLIQYPFETTTAAVDMLLNRIPQTHPNCKIILSHAGGTLPYLVSRTACIFPKDSPEQQDFMDGATSFYYDIALSNSHRVLSLLQDFAKPDHILFGSDYPYATPTNLENHIPLIKTFDFKIPELREKIDNKNALKLIPRLAQYYA